MQRRRKCSEVHVGLLSRRVGVGVFGKPWKRCNVCSAHPPCGQRTDANAKKRHPAATHARAGWLPDETSDKRSAQPLQSTSSQVVPMPYGVPP